MAKACIIPFVLYLLGTSFIARFGDAWYPLLYSVLVGIIAVVTFCLLRGQNIVRPHRKIASAIAVGLVGIFLWIVICNLQIEQMVGQYLPSFLRPQERVGFNPFEKINGALATWAFIAARMIGIAIIVPVAEELFWRSFLLRWLIDPDWEKIPLGEYTFSSCAIVTLMFTLAHPEWLAAAVYCLLINGLLYWKRDLWLCIVAHGVSNFALAIYVLATGHWWLW